MFDVMDRPMTEALDVPADELEWTPTIPPGLDDMPADLNLAATLSAINVADLSGHDRVVVLRAHQRMASHHQAMVYDAMVAVSRASLDDDTELGYEAAAAEIRAALRLTRRAADTDLTMALDLRHRLPRVWRMLADGQIDPRRAAVVVDATSHLSAAAARTVADEIGPLASGLTTGQLRQRIRRMCVDADPDDARDRYRQAVDERRLVLEPTVDGTANLLGMDLPPDRATTVARRIDRMARSLRTAGETRTMDQLRADVYLDILTGTIGADGPGGTVDISVDLETLTGLADHAGDLAGYGPVIADIARQTVDARRSATWQFTVRHPDTGMPLTQGTTRRRPTADQKRSVTATSPTCVFPGCRMPARDCDLDHRTRWADGGATTPENLVPLCRHDHRIRHEHGWEHELTLTTTSAAGEHRWTSRLGHTYTTSGRSP